MDRRDKLIEAGLALSSELSLQAVLQRITDLAVEITEARYGALAVVAADGSVTGFVTSGISAKERAKIGDPPTGRGLLGELIRDPKPLRIADISTHPASIGFPKNHPPMTSLLGAPVVCRGTVLGNIYLTDKRGAEVFDEEDERAIGVLAAQAGVAVWNARLYEETKRRERWLDAVREIATAILSGAGSDEALHLVARRARELVGADFASIAIPVPGTDQLILAVTDGKGAEALLGTTFPIAGSVSGEVVETGRAIILADASADPNAYQPLVKAGDHGPAMFVPLSAQGLAFGTLAAANLRHARRFGDTELRLLETFADQAALALEYARAQREVQRLAVLEDRERIAKELHDGVIQSLFAVGMGLEGTALISGDEELARRIENSVAELDRVIRDLRNYIFGLRPGILADRQLHQAIRHLVEEFAEKSGVTAVSEIDESVASELTPHAHELIQVVRETLSNVGRHAEATTCRVSLRRKGAAAELEIDDDGKGFDPETAKRGDGLPNLEKRAEALGGKATIDSSPEQGTTIRIAIPL
jgi:signal transduction histidine kinase